MKKSVAEIREEGRARAAAWSARIYVTQLIILGFFTTAMPIVAPAGVAVLSFVHMTSILPIWAAALEAIAVEGAGFVIVHQLARVSARNAAIRAIVGSVRRKSDQSELLAMMARPVSIYIAFGIYFVTVVTLNTIGDAVYYAESAGTIVTTELFVTRLPHIAMNMALAMMTIPAAIIAGSIQSNDDIREAVEEVRAQLAEAEATRRRAQRAVEESDEPVVGREEQTPRDWRKLSDEERAEIAQMVRNGAQAKDIAERYGVSPRTARNWISRVE